MNINSRDVKRNSNSRTSPSSHELRISNLNIEYRFDTFGLSAHLSNTLTTLRLGNN